MTGTLYGLSRSQQLDANSRVMSGCLLYLYDAGTSTPIDSFSDFFLTQLNPWPLEADSAGRIPPFWLADGSYRARLTDASAVLVFDEDNVQAIGPSTGTPTGSGVDPTSVRMTGDFFWLPINSTRSGSVRANGRTIGSVASGATERANADVQALYEFFWNNFTNAICPVTSGRGGSAVADFNANKSIGTVDMRGRSPFGLDTMGNSAASVLVTGTPTVAASATGAEKTTIAQANLPNYNLTISTLSVTGSGQFSYDDRSDIAASGGNTIVNSIQGDTGGEHTITITDTYDVGGTLASGGSGTAATTISPGRLGTWYIKL